MNSDTPRTDALLEQNSCGRKEDDCYGDDWSTQDILDIVALARTLERENQQLRANLDRWKETCHQLGHDELSVNSFHKALSENIQLRLASGFCNKHQPNGGARSCLVCGTEKLSYALDKISYICSEPNEMRVSNYSVNYNEDEVLKQVEQLRYDLKKCVDKFNHYQHNGFSHIENNVFIKCIVTLPSIQAALKTK